MNERMLFSIITVTRNNLDGLRATQNSIAIQHCADFEWIVVDGASTDGTPEWLDTTAAHWTSEPDRGIYDAMNKGIDRAAGDYLLFLNAGDCLCAPDTLTRIKKSLQNEVFVYGDALETRGGALPAYKFANDHDSLPRGMFTHHQAMLYRRDAIGNVRYNTQYKIAADYDFTARFLIAHAGAPVLYCDFPLCLFEEGGVSQKHTDQGRQEQFAIRRALALAGPTENRLIALRQWGAVQIRRISPDLYWRLRA